jgi:hypothetical protein
MEGAIAMTATLAFIWGIKYLQTQKRLRQREMIHRERLAALEKGIPLPEIPLPDEPMPRPWPRNILPRLTLGCGILLVTGGAGMLLAFRVSPMREINEAWSLGYIPLLIGGGCLLYSILLFVLRHSDR